MASPRVNLVKYLRWVKQEALATKGEGHDVKGKDDQDESRLSPQRNMNLHVIVILDSIDHKEIFSTVPNSLFYGKIWNKR